MNEPSITLSKLNEITRLLALTGKHTGYDKENDTWYCINDAGMLCSFGFSTWLDAAFDLLRVYLDKEYE
jgi:hypothetical protein